MFTTRFGASHVVFHQAQQVGAAGQTRGVVPNSRPAEPMRLSTCLDSRIQRVALAFLPASAFSTFIGVIRHHGHPHADRVGHRIRDRRRCRPPAVRPGRSRRACRSPPADVQVHHDLTDVARCRPACRTPCRRSALARQFIHDALFHQRAADAHDAGAEDLALGRLRIDHQPSVLHRDHPVHLHDAGFDVDVDVGDLHAAHAAVFSPSRPRRTFGPVSLIVFTGRSFWQAAFHGMLFAGLSLTMILPSTASS